MLFEWFFSRTVRQATELRQQAVRLVNEQRDVLSAEAVAAILQAAEELRAAIRSRAGKTAFHEPPIFDGERSRLGCSGRRLADRNEAVHRSSVRRDAEQGGRGRPCSRFLRLMVGERDPKTRESLEAQMTRLTEVANEQLKPYPHAATRQNVKELFVAATVILTFTTFFLQLTKIPTGSMQPTLYGVTFRDLRDDPDFKMPSRLTRFLQYWFHGISYYQVTAQEEGVLHDIAGPELVLPIVQRVVPFVKRQRFKIGNASSAIWFPHDQLFERCGLREGQRFQKGQDLMRLKVVAGDHLLVDRFTYNFRRPERGEIIVFKTRGIPDLVQDQLYIKRLVALSSERVRIGNDQHLVINGERLNATTPGFENVYTFEPTPSENHYFGHVNQRVADRLRKGLLDRNFLDETREYVVGPRHYLAMGDNTLNSRDSRDWGDLPRENVIGKCWFVYWPFTQRFGWGVR